MTKHLTAELTGNRLNQAVAIAAGITHQVGEAGQVLIYHSEGRGHVLKPWYPSMVWEHGGPIIERERIKIEPHPHDDRMWVSEREPWLCDPGWSDAECPWSATSPLVAAMRAFVYIKLGAEIDLP